MHIFQSLVLVFLCNARNTGRLRGFVSRFAPKNLCRFTKIHCPDQVQFFLSPTQLVRLLVVSATVPIATTNSFFTIPPRSQSIACVAWVCVCVCRACPKIDIVSTRHSCMPYMPAYEKKSWSRKELGRATRVHGVWGKLSILHCLASFGGNSFCISFKLYCI